MGVEVSCFAVPDSTWNVADEALPAKGRLVKYRTAQYQMLGYRDSRGNWTGSDGAAEALPVKAWREIVDPLPQWPERAA